MTMVISTSPANRYISLINCMCCVTLHDERTKLTDSFTSVRRKRSRRHCLFRHCSGTVCPQKFMKRRKKHRCVHLRVSQEVIFDHWKPCDKPKSDTNNINDTAVHEKQPGQEVANNSANNVDTLKTEGKTKDIGEDNLPRSSPKQVELDQTFSQCINKLDTTKEAANSNTKYTSEDISEAQRKSSSCKIEKTDKYSLRKTSFKKRSQSDTSRTDTVITDNSMISSSYHKSHPKRIPSVKKKLSGEFKLDIANTKNVNSCQQSNVDKTEDIFDNASSFLSRQKQKCETKHFASKHRYNWKNNCTVTDRQNDGTSQKKLSKHSSRYCSCSIKERNHNSPQQWNFGEKVSSSKLYHPRCKMFTNLQKDECLCEHTKAKKKNNHLVVETRPSRYKAQSLHYKEMPTWIIFKNKRSDRSRILEETKFDNSTYSSYSSSTIFTDITETSLEDDCWCPRYKSLRYTSSTNPRKYNKYDTSIDPNGLMSSSSCLSSSNRCHSLTTLSQNSVYHEQQPVSSSSCTNIPRWKRRYLKNESRTSTYHSPTSSSYSLTSLSTYRDDYNQEDNYTDHITYNALKKNRTFREEVGGVRKLKQTQGSWRRPKCREQEKRIVHMDERRVAWNI